MYANVTMRVKFDDGWWDGQEDQYKADALLGVMQPAVGFRGDIERLSLKASSGGITGPTIVAKPLKVGMRR